MFYALTDTFTGNNPAEHTHGFANTKSVLAFRTRLERDTWVRSTKLLTAKSLTRSEAVSLAETSNGSFAGEPGDKIAPIYGTENDAGMHEYHVLRKSRGA